MQANLSEYKLSIWWVWFMVLFIVASFPSDIYYLEYFHWSNSEGDKLRCVIISY